jgi:hypothetical protein
MALGQAAGVAAAFAIESSAGTSCVDIDILKKRLLTDDVFLG